MFNSGSVEQGGHLCFSQHTDEGLVSMEDLLPVGGGWSVCEHIYVCLYMHMFFSPLSGTRSNGTPGAASTAWA